MRSVSYRLTINVYIQKVLKGNYKYYGHKIKLLKAEKLYNEQALSHCTYFDIMLLNINGNSLF